MENKEIIKELEYQIDILKDVQEDVINYSIGNGTKFERNRTAIECSNAIRENMKTLREIQIAENIAENVAKLFNEKSD